MEIVPWFQQFAIDRKYLAVGGVLSGFFGGLSGHQGAFRSIFLLRSGLWTEAFIASNIAIAILVERGAALGLRRAPVPNDDRNQRALARCCHCGCIHRGFRWQQVREKNDTEIRPDPRFGSSLHRGSRFVHRRARIVGTSLVVLALPGTLVACMTDIEASADGWGGGETACSSLSSASHNGNRFPRRHSSNPIPLPFPRNRPERCPTARAGGSRNSLRQHRLFRHPCGGIAIPTDPARAEPGR